MSYSVAIQTAQGIENFEFNRKSYAARVYQIMCREERKHPTGVERILFKENDKVALECKFQN